MYLKPVSLALLGMLFPFFYLTAQNAQISGKVIDPEDQLLAYANITLNNQMDSSLVKVDITDEQGQFKMMNLEPGDYWLEITYVGLPALKEAFSLTPGEKKAFETLRMPSATGADLEQVVVAAKRPLLELKNDKMIFNVENSINATGSNALQLLRKSPGVLVDNNDEITLLGRAGVRIFINGKPSPLRSAELASYLESLQSTDIDAIEIITNPGSKYEAEGNAGIINIRLRKDKGLGANGNLNLGYGVGIRTRYNAGLSGNYRNKWMNVYGSYSFTQNYWLAQLNFDRTQYAFKYDQHNTMMGGNQPQNFRAGADFFLNKNSTLGLLVDGGFNNIDQRVRGRTTLGTVGSEIPDSLLISENTRSGNNFNINYNLNYLWQMKKDASLSIDLNYGTYLSDGTELQPNYYKDLTEAIILSQNINETMDARDIGIKALKVDYETPLAGGAFGAGIKISEVRTDNDFQFFNILDQSRVVDEDRTNNFIFEENVNAAYFNFSRKINKSVNFQVGLRAEDTRSTGRLIALKPTDNEEVKRSYLDWFPSASLNISADDNNQVQFSYSRRINRPSYQALNPFRYQLDELTFHQGNPFVQPEYSNIFQVRHSFRYKLNTTLSYSRTTDMMTLQPQAGEGKVGFRTWINLAEQQDYSINIAAPTPITDWWSSFVSLTAYHRKNTGDFGGENVIDLEVNAFNLYSQQSFTVRKGLTLELSGFYNSPTIVQASAQAGSQWSMDFGLKMQVLNGNGNLTLGLTDIFKTNRWRGEVRFGAFNAIINNRWDSRRLNVNFSYFFGNRQVKKARNRKTGLDEEKKRTS